QRPGRDTVPLPVISSAENGAASEPRARWALTVLLLAYILSFIDRNVMAILVGPIRKSFEISDFQYGLLHGLAFTIFYTLVGLPIGRLADRRSRRTIIGVGVLFWSVMTCACGMVRSFGGLFAARMGVGLGEAALSPPAHSLLSDLFPAKQLPRAMSIFTLGITIGGGMAYMIGGWVLGAVGDTELSLPFVGVLEPWQLTFILIGLPGFAIGALVWTIREPARRGRTRAEGEGVPLGEVLRYFRSHARLYGAILGSVSMLSVLGYGTITWYVEMLIRNFGAQASTVGPMFGWIFMVAGSLGALSGGLLAERMTRRYADANLRVVVFAALLWLAPGIAGPLMPSQRGALLMAAPILFLMSSYFGPAIAALQTSTPNEMRALASALLLFAANLFGLALGPPLVGALTTHVLGGDQTLHIALAGIAAVFAPLAALIAAWGLPAYARRMTSPGAQA
ncbi:MAG: MFS transporter, partial [Polyangiales bacterium]